jgi:hypothetical protein
MTVPLPTAIARGASRLLAVIAVVIGFSFHGRTRAAAPQASEGGSKGETKAGEAASPFATTKQPDGRAGGVSVQRPRRGARRALSSPACAARDTARSY